MCVMWGVQCVSFGVTMCMKPTRRTLGDISLQYRRRLLTNTGILMKHLHLLEDRPEVVS